MEWDNSFFLFFSGTSYNGELAEPFYVKICSCVSKGE